MNKIIMPALWLCLCTSACGKDDMQVNTDQGGTKDTIALYPPVETEAKLAPDQQPAFEAQTRRPGVRTSFEVQATPIAEGLQNPWGMDFLPNGSIVVSERVGRVRIITPGGAISDPLEGVPAVRTGGEGGMLDIKVDPDFAATRTVFLSYVQNAGGGGVNCIARATLSADERRLENLTVIYRVSSVYPSANHYGSRMIFDAEKRLYITLGDRFSPEVRIQAQSVGSPLGKVIRLNRDGSPAPGNPFSSATGGLAEIWTYGHRNPQGLAVNPVTKQLWSSDHGPNAGDEINILRPGANYGWPVISYGLEYSGQPVSGTGLTRQDGMEQPVYYWDPAIAPSGMTFYTGADVPEWKNDLFVASLRGRHIVRLVINNATNTVIGEERLLQTMGRRFRLVTQGPDGMLYALTDDASNGGVYRIGR